MAQSFTLVPFKPGQASCTISGIIDYTEPGLLDVRYKFSEDLTQITWPATSDKPQRKDGLWQQTCMELFIAEQHSERYFEFNFSPSGDWQCYEFSSYRESSNFLVKTMAPKIEKIEDTNSITFVVSVDISALGLNIPLDVGINTVLLQQNGNLVYFSLSPQLDVPDFHFRDGFKLTLE